MKGTLAAITLIFLVAGTLLADIDGRVANEETATISGSAQGGNCFARRTIRANSAA
mgnify:CR=1 FL=1